MNDAPPDSAVGSSLFKSHVGLRVHMCLCAELPAHRLFTRMRSVCWVSLHTEAPHLPTAMWVIMSSF